MGILNPASYSFSSLDYFFWSAIINASVAFVTGSVVLNRDPAGRKNISFFLFAMSIFAWALPYAVWHTAATAEVALFWNRALMGGAIFVTVAFLNFTLEILELKTVRYRIMLLSYLLVMEFFAVANLTPLFVRGVEPAMFFEYWPQPGVLFLPFLIIWFTCFAAAGTLLAQGIFESEGEVRNQRKLIFIGFAIGIAAGSTNFLLWFGIEVAPWANLASSVYVLMVSYAMLRYRLFNISPSTVAANIVETMGDALFIVNSERRIAVSNESAARIVGLPVPSLFGKQISTFLPCAHDVIDRLINDDERHPIIVSNSGTHIRSGGGRQIPISLSVSRVPIGRDEAFLFICHDISNLREKMSVIEIQGAELAEQRDKLERSNIELTESKEEVLRALETVQDEKVIAERERERSQTILRSIGDGVFVVDREGRLVMVNTTAERMAGKNSGQVMGRLYDDHFKFSFSPDSEDDDFIMKSMDSMSVTRAPRTTVMIAANDRLIPVAVSAAPLVDESGDVFGAVAIIRDETKERAIDQAKTEFVSIASHQLRTPLSSIKWLLEMLEDSCAKKMTKQQQEYMSMLKRATGRMTNLVNDLLNVSQIESGHITLHPQPTDMDRLCEAVIEEMMPSATSKELKLAKLQCQIGMAHIDPNLISNVLQNLLSNAIKYTPTGGTVEVCGERSDGKVIVYVRDTGIGIPLHEQDKIFRKFFRGDNIALMDTEGRGLGLYIVKSVVESSGGKVWLESEVGRGSKFYLSLPVGDDSKPSQEVE